MKGWKQYGIFAVSMLIVLIILGYLDTRIMFYQRVTSSVNPYIYMFIYLVFGLFFGVIIGLESFIKERRIEGKWLFNVPRILIVGLPCLFFSLYNYIYFNNIGVLVYITSHLPNFILQSTVFIRFNQILLGYLFITNFTKQRNSQASSERQQEGEGLRNGY